MPMPSSNKFIFYHHFQKLNACASRQPATIPTQTINTCRLLFISDKRVSFIKNTCYITMLCYTSFPAGCGSPNLQRISFLFPQAKNARYLKKFSIFCDFLITSLSSFFIFWGMVIKKSQCNFLKYQRGISPMLQLKIKRSSGRAAAVHFVSRRLCRY